MSKNANAGELRTGVSFMRTGDGAFDADGFPICGEVNVFGDGIQVMGKWVNAHGSEVFIAKQLELRDPATFTTRYSQALCDETLIAYKENDTRPYEVISIDNVENRNMWLEIKLQRKVTAR